MTLGDLLFNPVHWCSLFLVSVGLFSNKTQNLLLVINLLLISCESKSQTLKCRHTYACSKVYFWTNVFMPTCPFLPSNGLLALISICREAMPVWVCTWDVVSTELLWKPHSNPKTKYTYKSMYIYMRKLLSSLLQ